MKTGIYTRIMKSNYDSDYMGRKGKSFNSRRRWRNMLKSKVRRQLNKDVLSLEN